MGFFNSSFNDDIFGEGRKVFNLFMFKHFDVAPAYFIFIHYCVILLNFKT